VLVLELGAEHRACYGAHDSMSAHLVASKVPCCTATHGAQQASIALSLRIGVGRAGLVLCGLAGLAVRVLALTLRVLVRLVSALLGELVVGLSPGVGALLVAVCAISTSTLRDPLNIMDMANSPLLWLLAIWCYLLSMLETAVVWYAILLTVALLRLLLATVVTMILWLLLGRIGRLLIATLVVALLRRVLMLILALGRVLLVVLLVVLLIVGAGHCALFVCVGSENVRRGYSYGVKEARN
jgi:hypothetical protein